MRLYTHTHTHTHTCNLKKNKIIKIENTTDGITLIALVITIIVLLILAGISISVLSGDNGILKQAVNAKKNAEEAARNEEIQMAIISATTSENINLKVLNKELSKALGYEVNIKKLPATIAIGDKNQTITEDGTIRDINELETKIIEKNVFDVNTKLEDSNGDSITIPANFKISSESPIVVTQGMIIEDSEENQYVWIPVFENTGSRTTWGIDWSAVKTAEETFNNDNTEANKTAYYKAIQTALKTYTTTYTRYGFLDEWFQDTNYGYYAESDTEQKELIPYTNGNMTEEEYNTLYNNMLNSIYKNGGFYIGRYEMGIAVAKSTDEATSIMRTEASKEYKSSGDNTTNQAPTIEGMTLPISKANAVPYNWITQPQAQMLVEKLGEKSDYANVESSLMFGVQWDAVCVFIEKYDTNNTATNKSEWLTNNECAWLWGNYHSVFFSLDRGYHYSLYEWKDPTISLNTVRLCTTGAADRNSSLNIYDFSGNVTEFILEKDRFHYGNSVIRGGSFSNGECAAFRSIRNIYSCGEDNSSRATFFIK